jgi:hypothetical protein
VKRSNPNLVRRAAVLAVLVGAVVPFAGGCCYRCTGITRAESARSVRFAAAAESNRFSRDAAVTGDLLMSLPGALSRSFATAADNIRDTAEIYGGCSSSTLDDR